jgi:hypothetical protein
MGGGTIIWIVIGLVAITLFAVGLFRARRGWSKHPASARNAHSESDAAAWLSKFDRGQPGSGF